MIVTSEILADTIVELLQEAGVADGNVYGVRAYPTQTGRDAQVQLMLPSEQKRPAGGRVGGNQFVVVATLPLVLTVQTPADVDEAGAAAARGALADLIRQIETTLVGAPALQRMIQRIASVDSHPRVNGDGAVIVGEAVWMLGLEFYQGPEDFYVERPVPLEEVAVSRPDGGHLLDLPDLNS